MLWNRPVRGVCETVSGPRDHRCRRQSCFHLRGAARSQRGVGVFCFHPPRVPPARCPHGLGHHTDAHMAFPSVPVPASLFVSGAGCGVVRGACGGQRCCPAPSLRPTLWGLDGNVRPSPATGGESRGPGIPQSGSGAAGGILPPLCHGGGSTGRPLPVSPMSRTGVLLPGKVPTSWPLSRGLARLFYRVGWGGHGCPP